MIKGIDVNEYQGSIDWEKVKEFGIEFAILRAGIGTRIDDYFEQNYSAAKKVGISVGAFWYVKSITSQGILAEAEAFEAVLQGKQLEYPVFMDLEYSQVLSRGKEVCSSFVRDFCNYLDSKNYWAGLYTSRSFLQTYFDDDVKNNYTIWVADWTGSCKYNGTYGIWQSSEKGSVPGIKGNVDTDISYVDYPEVIPASGKNGFTKTVTQEPAVEQDEVEAGPSDIVDRIFVKAVHDGHQYSGTLYLDED